MSTTVRSWMKRNLALLFVAIALSGCVADKSHLEGVYSNGKDGFNASSLILSPSGDGLFMASAGGVFGSWDVLRREGKSYVHMRWADGNGSDVIEGDALFLLNEASRSLAFVGLANSLDEALSNSCVSSVEHVVDREKNYTYITNAIPLRYEKMIAAFPAYLATRKLRTEYKKRQREVDEGLAKREQTRYEDCLSEIRANPRKILTVPFTFYREDEGPKFMIGRTKLTPELRAVMVALDDKSIRFPEDVLMSFLNRYEWETCFYVIAPVFVRDELTSDSRRRLHPRMRDYAERLDGMGAGAFYNHKNTPIDLVRDASHWDGFGRFKDAIDSRLKQENVEECSPDKPETR